MGTPFSNLVKTLNRAVLYLFFPTFLISAIRIHSFYQLSSADFLKLEIDTQLDTILFQSQN